MGWCDMDDTWKPVWMTLPEAAKACLELLKVSVKENEVPTEKNSSRASIFATNNNNNNKGKLYIKLKLKDQITL